MITVDKGKLKFLKAGRIVTVDVEREYRKGRAYQVRLEGSKTTKLACTVVDRFKMGEDCWRLSLKQDIQEKQWYLSANPGAQRNDYTQDVQRAARDTDGPMGRPDEGWLDRIVKPLSERDDQMRRERAHEDRQSRWRSIHPKPLL